MEGIKPITAAERTFSGSDFFLLWAGAAISLAEVLAGGILAPLGLVGGMTAILVGHVVGNTPFALGGVIGSETGLPSMVTLRPSFGTRGSNLAAGLNIVQLLGWTAVMLAICGRAADVVSTTVFGYANYSLWVVLAGTVTTLWALSGRNIWKWVQNLATIGLLGLSAIVTYTLLKDGGLSRLLATPPTGGLPYSVGLDIVISMPISWLPLAADYSRFARRSQSAFWGTWLGYFVVSSWMFALGLAAALQTGSADFIPILVAAGLGLPALLIVLFSTFTTTFLNIYSTAISALSISSRLGEKGWILIGGVMGTLVALVFPIEQYESFLLLIGAMFCPVFGIALADYFVRRRGDGRKMGLSTNHDYPGGVNPVAIGAWVAGFVLYQTASRAAFVLGASIPSLLAAGMIYLVLMKQRGEGKR